MTEAGQQQQPVAVQEGSRWLHAKPTGEQFAQWFSENVPVHDGLDVADYVGGITLISATEKLKATRWKANNDPFTVELEQAVFIPYAKVETRVKYFRDLMEQKADEWIGVIAPGDVNRYTDMENMQRRFFNGHLPPGFFIHPQTWFAGSGNSKTENVQLYVGYAAEVLVYRKDDWFEKGREAHPVMQGFGTKAVPCQKQYPDDTALMKAETGAVGRALGMAGMLVIPGSGVATAEDVQEAQAAESAPPPPQTPEQASVAAAAAAQTTVHTDAPAAATQAPTQATTTQETGAQPVQAAGAAEEPTDEQMRERVTGIIAQLESRHTATLERFRTWYREQAEQRNMGELHTLQGPALRGVLRRLERALAQADAEAAEEPSAEAAEPSGDASEPEQPTAPDAA